MEKRFEGFKEVINEDAIKTITPDSNALKIIYVPQDLPDTSIPLQEIIDSAWYVKLETTPKSLIGHVDKLFFSEDRIIVVDRNKAESIFIFDQHGKYINKISSKGKGPGEFLRIRAAAFDDDKMEIVVLDDHGQKLNFYGIDGAFKKSQRIHFYFIDFNYIGDGKFVHYLDGGNEHLPTLSNYSIVFTGPGEHTDSKSLPFYTPLPNNDGRSLYSLMSSGTRTFFTAPFNDTTYSITSNTSIAAKYHIQQGDRNFVGKLPKDVSKQQFFEKVRSTTDYYFQGKILEVPNAVYIDLGFGIGVFYSLASGHFAGGKKYMYGNLQSVDYFRFPEAVHKNAFVAALNPYNVAEMEKVLKTLENKPRKRSLAIENYFSSVNNADNPILMFYTMKDF